MVPNGSLIDVKKRKKEHRTRYVNLKNMTHKAPREKGNLNADESEFVGGGWTSFVWD